MKVLWSTLLSISRLCNGTMEWNGTMVVDVDVVGDVVEKTC